MEIAADGKQDDVVGERLAAHVVQAVKGWLAQYALYLKPISFLQASFDRSLFGITMPFRISFACLRSGSNLVSMMKSVTPWGVGFQQWKSILGYKSFHR
jgi:hypothetical protein